MKCRYQAVFVAHTISKSVGTPPLEIYSDVTNNVRVLLTDSPDEVLRHGERETALAAAVLKVVFGAPDPSAFDEKLSREVTAITESRRKSTGSSPVLVVTIDLDVEPVFRGPHRTFTDFEICLDAVDKDAVRHSARKIADCSLAALILATDTESPRFDRLAEYVFLLPGGDRVIYSLSLKARGTLLAGQAIADAEVDRVADYIRAANKGVDLTSVFGLLQPAVDGSTEPLRGFVAAWTALEIFTNKTFKSYEQQWFDEATRGRTSLEVSHLTRIRAMIKDKYRLLDKFTMVATMLDSAGAEQDVGAFKGLKEIRDDLFHGGARISDTPCISCGQDSPQVLTATSRTSGQIEGRTSK